MVASFRLPNVCPEIESQKKDKLLNMSISQISLALYNRNSNGPLQETSAVQPDLGPIFEVPNGKIARCTVYCLSKQIINLTLTSGPCQKAFNY